MSFVKLQELDCSKTQITEIPISFVNLQKLNCPWTQITEIPISFVKLQYLNCYKTKIIKIPVTLDNLQYINSDLISLEKHKENVLRYKNKIKDIIKRNNNLNDDVNTLICSYI